VDCFRIYVCRNGVLRSLHGDYEMLEDAKSMFEKQFGVIPSCLIGRLDPRTERPTFVLYGEAAGRRVKWKHLQFKPLR
jgi:hypothetical protein